MIADFQLILYVSVIITMASGKLLDTPEVKDMAGSNTRFMLDLLRHCERKDGNVFFAPFSITTALAMTYMGARGRTAEEMKKVLKWTSAKAPTEGFGSYLPLLQNATSGDAPGYILAGAQRIYVSKNLAMLPDFSATTQKHFTSDAKQADFSGNPNGERQSINAWVLDQTRDKIRDLLPSGSIDPLTAMVLVQATYFKGNWLHKFSVEDTKKVDFHAPEGKVKVDMMYQRKKFPYHKSEALGCAAVELPYASNSDNASGHDLSMLVLLPDENVGLPKLESALNQESLDQILSSLHSVKVDLQLPRFKMESSFALSSVLSGMGMPLAFSDGADFSGMVTGPGSDLLYISEVFHKAVVEVNEEGSEAAAATAVVMTRRSLPVIHPFVADRPFLFLIVDRRADVVLFSGCVASPPAAEQPKDEL